MSDEAEAERLAMMQGLGEVSFMDPEDVKDYHLADFGLTLDDSSRP